MKPKYCGHLIKNKINNKCKQQKRGRKFKIIINWQKTNKKRSKLYKINKTMVIIIWSKNL